MVTTLLQQDPKHVPRAEKYLEKAKRLADDQRGKSSVARLFYLEGLIAEKKGNQGKARRLFRQSLKINPAKSNSAHKALKEV